MGQSVRNLTDADLDRILNVLAGSWATSTKGTYSAGLLTFHVFSDVRQVPDSQHGPASCILIIAFIANCAGIYSGPTLSNYITGVHAWHTLHGLPWAIDDTELRTVLRGGEHLAPPASKKPKRAPVTIELLLAIHSRLLLAEPLDVAVYACLTTTFFAAARLGEFVLPTLSAFRADEHVKPADIQHDQDRRGNRVTVFHLPRTKMAPITGEDIYWVAQPSGPHDPAAALANHLAVYNPAPNGPLFARRYCNGTRPLTQTDFLKRLEEVSVELGRPMFKGHGLHIGGTLEYLLRGESFEAVKAIGCWSGDSFKLYLRKHTVILAPYLQEKDIFKEFNQYVMPPRR